MSTLASVCIYDVYSNLPSAGIPGRMFYVSTGTNAGKVYRDNGSSWDNVAAGSASPLTTKGDLYGFSTTNARIPVGSDGQVLTADSTQTLGVKWDTPGGGGGGGLVLIDTKAASNSSELDFVSDITSTYDDYLLDLSQLLPVTGGNYLRMQFSTDNGSTYDSGTNYEYEALALWASSTAQGPSSTGDTSFSIVGSNWGNSTMGANGIIRIFNPLNGSLDTAITFDTIWYHDGISQSLHINGGGRYKSSTAVNAFRLFANSGNIASGTARLYGLAK